MVIIMMQIIGKLMMIMKEVMKTVMKLTMNTHFVDTKRMYKNHESKIRQKLKQLRNISRLNFKCKIKNFLISHLGGYCCWRLQEFLRLNLTKC